MAFKERSMLLSLLLLPITVLAEGNCTFENGMCGWSNLGHNDITDWDVEMGSTTSLRTGPSSDHTRGNYQGKYIYLETSPPRRPGDNAILISPKFSPTTFSRQCMTFYYHMHGSTIGTLSVLVQPKNKHPAVLWSLTGEQGDTWLKGVVAIPQVTTDYWILIEGVRGSCVTGDIAVDDITIATTPSCTFTPDKASPVPVMSEILVEPIRNTINVVSGENVTVNCIVNETITVVTAITWSHNGRNSSGRTFFIQNVTKSDEGQLSCTANGRLGTRPGIVHTFIRVLKKHQDPLLVHMEPNSDIFRINEREKLTVKCVVAGANPAVTTITWTHNGQNRSGDVFQIRNVTQSDEGRLTCTARNGEDTAPGRVDAFIRVLTESYQEEPVVYIEPKSDIIRVTERESLTVNCVVNDAESYVTSVTWSHNGRIITGSRFHIENVTKSDEGRLTCMADSGVGRRPGRADTFIRVLNLVDESAERRVSGVTSGTSKWMTIDTVAFFMGIIALLLICVLVVVILLYRKINKAIVQEERKGYSIGMHNPVFDHMNTEDGLNTRL